MEGAGHDWYGTTARDAARRAVEIGRAKLVRAGGQGPALGGVFWHALLRGGVQGGLYVLDSARAVARGGDPRLLERA
jgi:hypothetical protein